MHSRFQHPISPVILLSVAMVIGMGMAAEASAGPVMFCPRSTLCQGDGERDSVARWLTTFSSSFRTLHSQGVALNAPPRPSQAFTLACIGSTVHNESASLEQQRPSQPHLIDLPPPAL